MKYIHYFCDSMQQNDSIDDAERFLSSCVLIAAYYQLDGGLSFLYLTDEGVPVVLMRYVPNDYDNVKLPAFAGVDVPSSELSIKSYSGNHVIADLLSETGKYSLAQIYMIVKRLRQNIQNGNRIILVDR